MADRRGANALRYEEIETRYSGVVDWTGETVAADNREKHVDENIRLMLRAEERERKEWEERKKGKGRNAPGGNRMRDRSRPVRDRAFSRNRTFLESVRISACEHVRARNDAYLAPR